MAISASERHRLKAPRLFRRPAVGRMTRRVTLEQLESRTLLATNWTPLTNQAPTEIQTMELLPNGTVMAATYSSSWYLLTPSSTGSYVNGTWSKLADEPVDRLYTGTAVLQNGDVVDVGGEYINGDDAWANTGDIYDSATNTWSTIANFPQSNFGDDPLELLENGDLLGGFLGGPQTYLYDPTTNVWTETGTKNDGDQTDEEGWVKLPDDSILSYDVWYENGDPTGMAQRYIQSTGTWVNTGPVPLPLSEGSEFELGPNALLPNGKVIQIGDNSNTAIFDPSTDTNTGGGTWTAGPTVPGGYVSDDAAGVLLPDGQFIFTADKPNYTGPAHVFDYDYISNTITDITPSTGNGDPADLVSQLENTPSFTDRFLMLPTGQALFTAGADNQLYVYTGTGAVNSSVAPSISGITNNGSNSYTLTGSSLNGASEGASYGDDAQMASNYPIVSVATEIGTVYYADSSDWNMTGVGKTNGATSVNFALPSDFSKSPVVTADSLNPKFGYPQNNVTVATFTDPNGTYTGEHSATIDWGDGTETAGTISGPNSSGVYTVKGTHTYITGGLHTLSVDVIDSYASGDLTVSGSGVSSAPTTFNVSTAGTATVTVIGDSLNTDTDLITSLIPSIYGQPVTFTATVNNETVIDGVPTGSVIFYDGSKEIGVGTPLAGSGLIGTSTLRIASLSAGTHSIHADYSPTGLFGDSTGTVSQDVQKAVLVVSGVTAASKEYDSTTIDTAFTSNAALVGVLRGDSVTLNTGGAIATFLSPSVGTNIPVTVTGLTISGPQASDYTLAQPTMTANITPAYLTVSGVTAATKTYDASTTASIITTGATLSGVFSGDSVSLVGLGATGTFATKNVGNGIAVTVAGLTLGGQQAGDYTLIQPTTTGNIIAAPLRVSGITAANKTYDTTDAATLTTTNAALVGLLGDDSVTLNTTGATGTFASASAGNGVTVTVAGVTIGGAQAGDYTLVQPTTTANIIPAALTVSGITAANKPYDGTTTAVLDTADATLAGVLGSDSVNLDTGNATGVFASQYVATGLTVTVTGLTLTGPQAGDYTVTDPTTTASITQATPTINVASAGGTFTGVAQNAIATLLGVDGQSGSTLDGVAPTFVYYAGSTATGTPLAGAPINVNTYTVVATFPGSGDYASTTSGPFTFNITPATPTVEVSAVGVAYTGAPFNPTTTVTGVTGSPASTLEGVTPTLVYYVGSSPTGTALAAAINAGTYTVVAEFPGSADYGTATSAPATFTILKATPTLTFTSAGGDFDGNPVGATVAVTGLGPDNSPTTSLEGATPTLTYYDGSSTAGTSLGSTAPTAIGTYTVVASLAATANYSAAQSSADTFMIHPGATTTSLTLSTGSAAYGQDVVFVARVNAPVAAGGMITFFDNGNPLTTLAVNGSNTASLTTSDLAIGTHSITATYSGDPEFVGSKSAATTTSVAKAATTVVLTPSPVLKNKKISSEVLTASVAPRSPGGGIPTGVVTFEVSTKKRGKIKTKVLGTAPISGGKATLTFKAKQVLGQVITTVYSGDTNYTASTLTPPKLSKKGLL